MVEETVLQNFIKEALSDKKFKASIKKYKAEIEKNDEYQS